MVLKVCVHEWLSGGVSPCQGEGRGFESRLALFYLQRKPLKRGSAVFYVQYNPYETGFIPPDRKILERVCKLLFVRYYSPDVRHTLREILVPVQPA